ncbi:hypothetical protein FS317_26215 [Microvirga sp. M8]|nr:hypothetical protein [Microvirga tunisiensis]
MEILNGLTGLGHGLYVAFDPSNLLYCFLGCLLGTMIGVLPGLGPLNAMAMLLPVSYYLPPEGAIIMLAGIYYGSQYGGSTTSILVNMPGETSSIVTCLDGHQMARQGRAGPALAIAALSSVFAGIASTLFIALLAPPLAKVALWFGPAEYVSLMVLGLIVAVVLAHGAVLPALGMIVLGLLLAVPIHQSLFRGLFGSAGVPIRCVSFTAARSGTWGTRWQGRDGMTGAMAAPALRARPPGAGVPERSQDAGRDPLPDSTRQRPVGCGWWFPAPARRS